MSAGAAAPRPPAVDRHMLRDLALVLGVPDHVAEDLEGLDRPELDDLLGGIRYELELAAGRTVTARNRRVRNRGLAVQPSD